MQHPALVALPLLSILLFGFGIGAAGAKDHPATTSVEIYNPSGVQEDGTFVDMPLRDIRDALGKTEPMLLGHFPETDLERISLHGPLDEEINALFLKRGWSDGLPIVAPTRERVRRMLQGTRRDRTDVVAVLPPMNGMATVEKIAVNAVMSGCRPEYMPVLLAAVDAVADPDFDLRGLATTTSPDVPCIIITGPIAKRLGLETDFGVMGRGNQGNNTIGRALQMIIHNVGGSRPGLTDMSCLGSPMEHGMLVVENPQNNPWPPFNEDVGLPSNADAVTVMGAEGYRGVVAHGLESADIIRLMGAHMKGLAWQRPRWSTILLVIPGETAWQLAHSGYTKERIRKELLQQNPIPREEFLRWFDSSRWGDDVEKVLAVGAENQPVQAPATDQLLILYAGGPGIKNMIIPGWFGARRAVTKRIQD